MNSPGVVAIGRNEGERLRRSLLSLVGRGLTIIYVDSGSTDGSVELAGSMGVEVVSLDMTQPFTAARGRNAGFERLLEVSPEAAFVMFLDGDCEVADGWLDRALSELSRGPTRRSCAARGERNSPKPRFTTAWWTPNGTRRWARLTPAEAKP